mmetsp:Transcript_5881/g.19471  ORF Transcript_5881/g.19471 Transcript_5881/m.19471 type:complete len:495 (-) Transcript_5881:571-2055(-)
MPADLTAIAAMKPISVASPTTSPPSSHASGRSVFDTMAIVAPPHKPTMVAKPYAAASSSASLVGGAKAAEPTIAPAPVPQNMVSHIAQIFQVGMPHALSVPLADIASGRLASATAATKPTRDGYASGVRLASIPITSDSGIPSASMPHQMTRAAVMPCAAWSTSARSSSVRLAAVPPSAITEATATASRCLGLKERKVFARERKKEVGRLCSEADEPPGWPPSARLVLEFERERPSLLGREKRPEAAREPRLEPPSCDPPAAAPHASAVLQPSAAKASPLPAPPSSSSASAASSKSTALGRRRPGPVPLSVPPAEAAGGSSRGADETRRARKAPATPNGPSRWHCGPRPAAPATSAAQASASAAGSARAGLGAMPSACAMSSCGKCSALPVVSTLAVSGRGAPSPSRTASPKMPSFGTTYLTVRAAGTASGGSAATSAICTRDADERATGEGDRAVTWEGAEVLPPPPSSSVGGAASVVSSAGSSTRAAPDATK